MYQAITESETNIVQDENERVKAVCPTIDDATEIAIALNSFSSPSSEPLSKSNKKQKAKQKAVRAITKIIKAAKELAEAENLYRKIKGGHDE